MTQAPEISIIIVSYNVKDLLFKCIASIKKFVSSSFEIIVIDNHSADDTAANVTRQFPEVKLIANNYNAGFPEANNQGLRKAKGNYIFLLNPDTELLEDSVSVLRKYLDSMEKAGVVAPKLLNSDGGVQDSIFRFPKLSFIVAEMFYLKSLVKKKYYRDKSTVGILEIDSASGAALFFRKSLLDKIGYLNPKLFWIEDIDFCFRVKESGLKTFYVPETRLIHHSGQSAKTNYNISISNQVINKIKYFKVHGRPYELILIYLLSLINVLMRIVIFGLISMFGGKYFLKMKAYIFTLPKIFSATKGL
jgi:N-acetylglucosaminyl-diphospho-decaprenol L-rhamnosyltransferase